MFNRETNGEEILQYWTSASNRETNGEEILQYWTSASDGWRKPKQNARARDVDTSEMCKHAWKHRLEWMYTYYNDIC